MNASRTETAVAIGDPSSKPLCVDLDGTLVRTDTLFELLAAALRDWRVLLQLPLWAMSGRAAFKQRLAQRLPLDAATLPYEERLLDHLRRERQAGRQIVLATAADRRVADSVARHLDLFDAVCASDGTTNLKGPRKARLLADRFGVGGYLYAGNDRADLDVWRSAAGIVVVNASPAVARQARAIGPVELELARERPVLEPLVRECRPYQWMKNLLVFVPLLTAGALGELDQWRQAALAFFAFSLVASCIYLLNDLSDLAADRAHPRKRLRPLASGDLDLRLAMLILPVLLVVGGWLAWQANVFTVLAFYAATSIAYSMWLKEAPLVDMFVLAALYTMRLYAGGDATGHPVSSWLLAFSIFLFFGLAAVKRVGELEQQSRRAGNVAHLMRRGYFVGDMPVIMMMGIASSFVASLVLALYVQSQWISNRPGNSELLWLLVPLILFWQCRLWLATARGYMDDDPIIYAARDWVSRLVALTGFAVFVAADPNFADALAWARSLLHG